MVDIPRHGVARKKMIKRVVLGIVVALAMGAVTYGLFQLEPAAPSVDRANLWMGKVEQGEMVRQVRGPGTLVPDQIWWVPARVDGRVERIFIKAGRDVQPGDIILELSNPQLQLDALEAEWQLKQAEANFKDLQVRLESELLNQRAQAAAVEADYEQAKLQADRNQKLAAENLVSDLDYQLSKVRADTLEVRNGLEKERLAIRAQSTEAQLDSQRAEIERRKALYELRLEEVANLRVPAGVRGVLQEVPVDVGQQVPAGGNLARIAQPETLIAELRIPETQAKDITIGQKVRVDARNDVLNGLVARIDPAVREGAVTVDVDLEGPLPSWVRPDLSVDGTVEIERIENIVYMGRPAHGQADSLISLFKLVDNGSQAVRVQVRLGRSSVNTIEVVEGLRPGEEVIPSDMSRYDEVDRVSLN